MKKLSMFLVSAIGFFTLSFAVHAKQNLTFEPIAWSLNDTIGELSISNNDGEKPEFKFVIVTVSQGAVSTFKKNPDNSLDCVQYIDDNSVSKSTFCSLAPGETLVVEKDHAVPGDATGTYQMETIG